MKLFTIFVFMFSLIFPTLSMEQESQPTTQQAVSISKTKQRIDSFVLALNEMEIKDDKNDRALLNFRHQFFTSYARELVAEPHGNALGDECKKVLNEIITEYSDNVEISFQELYAFCLFTVTVLSNEPEISWNDSIHDRSRVMLNAKKVYMKKFGNTQFYRPFFNELLNQQKQLEDNNHIPFITTGTRNNFYPFFLINSSFFLMEDYFYALSKRVHLLSLPYKPCKSLHGGYYSEPVEVFYHDMSHLAEYKTSISGSCPIILKPIEHNISYIFNMHERVGYYFFDLLQREDIDIDSKKKLKEVGFNLTHEGSNRVEPKFPSDSTLKSDLRYLIDCLKIHLKKVSLPDCLKSVVDFKSSLTETYMYFLTQQYSKELPAKLNKAFVSIVEDTKKQTFILTYKHAYEVVINYDFRKRHGIDWVKSAQRAGYKGKISNDGMEYDPTTARNFHLELLTWFEKTYLSKL